MAAQEEQAPLVASAAVEDLAVPTMLRALGSARQTQQVCKEQAFTAAKKAILGALHVYERHEMQPCHASMRCHAPVRLKCEYKIGS